jgi:hypothetical protein
MMQHLLGKPDRWVVVDPWKEGVKYDQDESVWAIGADASGSKQGYGG